MVIVSVAALQERRNAARKEKKFGPKLNPTDWTILPMFKTHQRSTNWEEFVTRDRSIVSCIKIAELPDGSSWPLLVQLSFNMGHLVNQIPVQLVTICEFLHHVEQPFTHSSREVDHLFFSASLRCWSRLVKREKSTFWLKNEVNEPQSTLRSCFTKGEKCDRWNRWNV